MARGSGFGGGFAQGLSQVLTQGLPVLISQRLQEAKLKQEEDELKIRKKLVEAQAEHLQMQSAKSLREAMAAGQLGQTLEALGGTEIAGGAAGPPFAEGPTVRGKLGRALAEAGHAKEALGLFPELTKQDPGALEGRLKNVMTMLGAGGGPGVASGTIGAPAMGGASAGASGPQLTFKPTINLDKQGNVSVSIAGQPTNFEVKHFQSRRPDGQEQLMQGTWDPTQGRWVTPPEAVGAPAYPEAIQRFGVALSQGYGLKPGSPIYQAALGEMLMIQVLPDESKQQALQELDVKLKRIVQHVQPAAAPAGLGAPDLAGARRRGEEAKTAETERLAGARERGARAEQALQGADRQKYEMLVAAERQADLVSRLFRPEFVGKGFSVFKKAWNEQEGLARTGRYLPGGMFGALLEWTGTGSPEEIQFRRAVADVSDSLLRARSGAQINEREYERLKRMLFRVTDEPATFLPALRRFQEEVGHQIDDVLETGTESAAAIRRRRGGGAPGGGPATLRGRLIRRSDGFLEWVEER